MLRRLALFLIYESKWPLSELAVCTVKETVTACLMWIPTPLCMGLECCWFAAMTPLCSLGRGVLLVSLVNMRQSLVHFIVTAHQLWKYILSHQTGGQWGDIVQHIAKLKSETIMNIYLSFYKATPFSCVGSWPEKDRWPSENEAVRRNRRCGEKVMCACLRSFPGLLMQCGQMAIFPNLFLEASESERWQEL